VPESAEILEASTPTESPLVFISHDARDAELAEAFASLLKKSSSGMLKTFWSSDKKGKQGIEFGDDWFKRLMQKLSAATDVVCLLSNRSLERPWLLFEAGVAKGKMSNTPVHGLALGIPLSKASTGPFYQFQNSDDSEEAITKLVLQLCERVPGIDPDPQVVRDQVRAFKTNIDGTLKKLAGEKSDETPDGRNDDSTAKILEELKIVLRELPSRIHQTLAVASQDMAAYLRAQNQSNHEMNRLFLAQQTEKVNSAELKSERKYGLQTRLSLIKSFLHEIAHRLHDFPNERDLAISASSIIDNQSPHEALQAATQLISSINLLLRGTETPPMPILQQVVDELAEQVVGLSITLREQGLNLDT
jgi:hypothetical protein